MRISDWSSDVCSSDLTLAHSRRWKTFLSGRSQHLSIEEVRGLFAEIVFLTELIDRQMSSSDAVEAWLVPERSHQDFIFGNTAVEVKTLSGAAIGRAQCRERVCQYVSITVVTVSFKKHQTTQYNDHIQHTYPKQ